MNASKPDSPIHHATQRHRLVVCTDLSSMQAGVLEPDDAQSMIRLLLHLDGIDLEGFLPGSALEHGHVVHGEAIAHRIIHAYAHVHPRLVQHDRHYPTADALHALVQPGQPVADRTTPPDRSVGRGLDTPASRHLVHCLDRADSRPLHVCLWGGASDVAQALWNIREERGPAGIAAISERILVHAIGDQDTAATWAKAEFPSIPWITRRWGYRGMYRGGDTSLVGAEWLRRNILEHGPLCGLYPIYDGGDIWIREAGRVVGLKEGDTPSWLGLIPNGLHAPEHPTWGGWGGRMRPVGPSRWTCEGVADGLPGDERDLRPEMSTVHRWRQAVQSAFALRALRCVHAPGVIPCEPVITIAGDPIRRVAPGACVTLHATLAGSVRTDEVASTWCVYAQPSTADRLPEIVSQSPLACGLRLPGDWSSGEAHIVLEARRSDGSGLCGYARVVLIPSV